MAIALQANDEALNSIIKRSSIGIKPKEKTEVLTEKSVVKVSNTITSLQNSFNKIYTYTLNVKNIHKMEEKRLQNIKKEVTMETKTSTASLAGGAAIDIGNLPDLFKQLTKSVEGLTKQFDKLDMSTDSNTGSSEIDDDDIDRRRRRRSGRRTASRGGRSRARIGRGLGRVGRVLGPAGILLDVASRASDDESAGQIAAGVGGGIAGGVLGAKTGAVAGGAIGALFGGVGAAPGAAIGGAIGGIGGYFGGSMLGDKAYEAAANKGSQRKLETAATNVARQQTKLEKGQPLGSTAFSSRFADYLNQSISNMTTWAMSASPMLTAIMAAGAGVMRIFSPNDYSLSGDTRADFQSIMDMAAAAGAPHPEIVAAQWALESGWGRSMSGRNNPFGQKATDNEPGTARITREVVNGQSINVTARFKDYATLDAAIAEHVRRWNSRYTAAGTSPLEAIQAIAARGYATDPNYVSSISRILAGQNIDPRQPFTYRAAASGTVVRSGTTARRSSGAFGERRSTGLHGGIDIPGTVGEPVASLQTGSVIFAGMGTPGSGYNDYGNVVHIRQDNGYEALYAHLHRITPGVRQGTRVLAAQIVGELGSTGRSSGPHLHFELRRGNAKLDPTSVYNSNPWIVGGSTPSPALFVPAADLQRRRANPDAFAGAPYAGNTRNRDLPAILGGQQQSTPPGAGWFGRDAWRRAQTR
jgi:murein DD-endopeptidase MepM/ murein hydrolase activator NlpD